MKDHETSGETETEIDVGEVSPEGTESRSSSFLANGR